MKYECHCRISRPDFYDPADGEEIELGLFAIYEDGEWQGWVGFSPDFVREISAGTEYTIGGEKWIDKDGFGMEPFNVNGVDLLLESISHWERMVDLLLESISHWERMMDWVEEQNPDEIPSSEKMRQKIEESWGSASCSLCNHYFNGPNRDCEDCPLALKYGVCNAPQDEKENVWKSVDKSETWEEWLKNAKVMQGQLEEVLFCFALKD